MRQSLTKAVFGLSALGVSLVSGTSTPVAADTLTLVYDTSWNGIDMARTELNVQIADGRYALSMATRTVGVAEWFSDGESLVYSSGRVSGVSFSVDRYETKGTWDGDAYRRYLEFDASGSLSHQEVEHPEEWDEKWPRAEIPEDARRGPDPLSLLMHLALRPLPGEKGEAFRSFDGRVVLENRVACAADAQISAVKNSPLSGEVKRCTLDFGLVEGRRIATEDDKKRAALKERKQRRRGAGRGAREDAAKQARNREPLEILIQYGPGFAGTAVGAMPIPSRMTLEAGWGDFVVSLVSVEHQKASALAR